jgi:predicted metal-binding protein
MVSHQVTFIILATVQALMVSEDVIKNLQKRAVEKGANSTKVIAVKDVFVEDWVRQKCEYGCNGYARHFTCPPYSPTPEETQEQIERL